MYIDIISILYMVFGYCRKDIISFRRS